MMTQTLLILLLFSMTVWFVVNEAPSLFGLYMPIHTMRRYGMLSMIFVLSLGSVLVSGKTGVASGVQTWISSLDIDGMVLLTVVLSSLICLSLLKMFSFSGTVVYAVLGAFCAFGVLEGYFLPGGAAQYIISFALAPVLTFVVSYLVSKILRKVFKKNRMHLITLSHYMRIAVACALIITSVAVGLNYGGFLNGLAVFSVLNSSPHTVMAVSVLAMLLLIPFVLKIESEYMVYYGDYNVYDLLSVGLSVALTLVFFSFDISTSMLGLRPVPLSVGLLVAVAIAGASLSCRSQLVESGLYVKELVSAVLSPVGSFLIAYILLRISESGEDFVSFIVMAVAIFVLLAVYFFGYVRVQRHRQTLTERLVSSQQQQIYENTRALNDMEIKVIMSENQALHNAVELKQQEVMNVALSIVEQKEYLESLNTLVKQLAKSEDEQEREKIISELGRSLRQRLSYERDVDSQYFYAQAESLHEDFNAKLSENHPDLTQQEKRLATLLRLGFSSKYIATLMNITSKSVEISRYRLRQKLGLSKGDNLVNYIKSI